MESILTQCLNGRFVHLREEMLNAAPTTVFNAYNRLTHHATHSMRIARTAFDMLERVTAGFPKTFPVLDAVVIDAAERGLEESGAQVVST